VSSKILVWDNVIHVALQIAILVVVWVIGSFLGNKARRAILDRTKSQTIYSEHITSFVNRIVALLPLLFVIFLLWTAIGIAEKSGLMTFLMRLVLSLSTAWVFIQLATSVILDPFWARLVAVSAWSIAALHIVGLLDEILGLLERIGFTLGNVNLTLLSIIKALIVLIILLRVVRWLNVQIEQRLSKVSDLTPSTRLMIVKGINITLLFLVTLMALNSVGINLTALAVFSGAVGVGVGFGLQKVVGNFVSGIILLSDKSIKPGDVIEIEDVYGWVNHMGGRYVSVITRDKKEYLIPNESLITNSVVNWSYTSNQIRIKADIGISYNADPHEAIELITRSLDGLDRIQNDPAPKCLLIGFGESSIDLQLRFWIKDPQNGVANITSEALLRVWDTLKANEIEIPFPQRDIHLKVPREDSIIKTSSEA
jgi:small-conductance mechanosensitive channel